LSAAPAPGCDVGSSPADADCWSSLRLSAPRHGTLSLRPSYVTTNRSLAALLPGSTVLVGSARIHAVPGMARRFGEPRWLTWPSVEEFTESPSVLYVDLNLLQSPAVGLQSGIGQKIVLRTGTLQVRLRDGDHREPSAQRYDHTLLGAGAPALVQTTAKQTWRYRTGALYSHIPFRLLAHDVRMRN
jgi:hypothetical protein